MRMSAESLYLALVSGAWLDCGGALVVALYRPLRLVSSPSQCCSSMGRSFWPAGCYSSATFVSTGTCRAKSKDHGMFYLGVIQVHSLGGRLPCGTVEACGAAQWTTGRL